MEKYKETILTKGLHPGWQTLHGHGQFSKFLFQVIF